MKSIKTKFLWRALFSIVLGCLFIQCVSKEYSSPQGSLTVMTYNVENLFDTLDDAQKSDETYLPKKMKGSYAHRALCAGQSNEYYRSECLNMDWSNSVLERKMRRLANVILQVKGGIGPDVLILQEVENYDVLEQLRLNHLGKANYLPSILVEGPDQRGIDVAILTRLPLVEKPLLHLFARPQKPDEPEPSQPLLASLDGSKIPEVTAKILSQDKHPTRGILQAVLQLPDGSHLTVFGLHLPSQAAPSAQRWAGLRALNELRKKVPSDHFVIAAGDFNITAAEEGRERFWSEKMSKDWLISHQLGCHSCSGTHNYRGEWSFLDVILMSPNLRGAQAWRVSPESIHIPNKSIYQVDHFGSPARFNMGRGQKGVADHWPLALDLVRGT